MSDDGSKTDGSVKSKEQLIQSTVGELDVILKEASESKRKFDEFVTSSVSEIEKLIEVAKAVSSDTDNVKNTAVAAKSAVEAVQVGVEQAGEKTKTILWEVGNLKTDIATAKGAIEENRKTATADLSLITQSKAEIESLHSTAKALSEKVDKEYQNVSVAIDELKERQPALNEALKEIIDVKAGADAQRNSVNEYIAEIERTKTSFVNLSGETQAQYAALVQKQVDIQTRVGEIERASAEIKELRKTLLEGSGDTKSIKDEITELRALIETILGEVSGNRDSALAGFEAFKTKTSEEGAEYTSGLNERFNALYKSLEQKILALLPTAGAAGLAWTYYDAKARYAPTPVAGRPGAALPEGRSNWLHRYLGYNPLSWGATVFFYALFMGPLALLALGTYDLIWQIEHNTVSVPGFGVIALRFLVAVPLATISTFGFISLRLYRKLYEQYNHKQRVMELYISFKREIEASGDADQKKKLLTIMLDSVAEKAWKDGDRAVEADDFADAVTNLDKFATSIAKWKSLIG